MKKSILFGIFFFIIGLIEAQNPYFIQINKASGLPSNEIYDIFQDSQHYIWIACGKGLVRYDGFEYKLYNNAKQSSKSGALIKEDKYGRIWYMNFDNFLYYVEKDSLHSFPKNESASTNMYALIEQHLLIPNKEIIEIWDIHSLQKIKEVALPKEVTRFQGSKQIGKSLYFFHYKAGIWKISMDGDKTFVNSLPVISMLDINVNICESENGLFIATKYSPNYSSIYHFSVTNTLNSYKIPISYIQNLYKIDHKLWFCTPKGLYITNTESKSPSQIETLFSEYNITNLLKDKEGNYWIGTSNEGILLIPDFNTKLYQQANMKISKLAQMENRIFMGTKRGEIFSFDITTKKINTFYQNEEKHELYFLYADSIAQQILCTSDKFRYIDLHGKIITSVPEAVKDAYRISKHHLAIAFSGAVALKEEKGYKQENPFPYSANSKTNYQHLLKSCRGKSLCYLAETKTLYFTTNMGTFKADTQKLTELLENGEKIYFSMLRNYGNEVYGLNTQGVLYKISENKPLIKDVLKGLIAERMKIVGNKLFLFSGKNLLYIDLTKPIFSPQKLSIAISAEEINDLIMVKENLYLATDKGLMEVDWHNLQKKYLSPILKIQALSFNGQKRSIDSLIEVPYTQNRVEINYAILSFRNETPKNGFYRINQEAWQPLNAQMRTLILAGLMPNQYEIELKLGTALQKVSFVIKPPFWRSNYFIALILLSLSLLVYIYYRFRTKILMQQNTLLLEKLALEKDLHHSLMASIKAQMNPHFFFNALNTLQSFIFSDDKRNAANYLGHFSRLMRMILEMSEKESISLAEEIEALQLYLSLEKTRFSEDFVYHFTIEQGLPVHQIQIPSMIIQPYIENAIKHGLLHKKNNRVLNISIEKQQENLLITIDDNGIGRKKAEELKQIKQKKHESFASKANQKRIELLNKEHQHIGLKYVDKIGKNGEAEGTTVIICLPLNTF